MCCHTTAIGVELNKKNVKTTIWQKFKTGWEVVVGHVYKYLLMRYFQYFK
jgi:hypothetical protein